MNRFTLAVIASVCFPCVCACEADTHNEEFSVPVAVTELAIALGSGDVKVLAGGHAAPEFRAAVTGASNHLGHDLSDGRLTVFDDCREPSCSVDITARVAADVAISIRTDTGDVQVLGSRGPLRIEADSGDISAVNVSGQDLSVEIGSGDVELSIFPDLAQVQATAGTGDVKVGVPSGAYQLEVFTGSGDRIVRDVEADPHAAASIRVETGTGDVSVIGR